MMKFTKVLFRSVTATLCAVLLFAHSHASVVVPSTLVIDDNRVVAKLSVTPAIDIDLTIEFDKSVGLNASNIDITAELISPADINIINRLPSELTNVVNALPVMLSIKPKSSEGFAFEGLANVEFYTKAIHYDPAVPLRLFTSHDGAAFEDITTLTTSGSFRARGSTGRFSDFIILLDTRLPSSVISEKIGNVADTLVGQQHNIEAGLYSVLANAVSAAADAAALADYAAALVAIDAAIVAVDGATGDDLPSVWRSSNDIDNVKGRLLTQLKTLRFSLRIL